MGTQSVTDRVEK